MPRLVNGPQPPPNFKIFAPQIPHIHIFFAVIVYTSRYYSSTNIIIFRGPPSTIPCSAHSELTDRRNLQAASPSSCWVGAPGEGNPANTCSPDGGTAYFACIYTGDCAIYNQYCLCAPPPPPWHTIYTNAACWRADPGIYGSTPASICSNVGPNYGRYYSECVQYMYTTSCPKYDLYCSCYSPPPPPSPPPPISTTPSSCWRGAPGEGSPANTCSPNGGTAYAACLSSNDCAIYNQYCLCLSPPPPPHV